MHDRDLRWSIVAFLRGFEDLQLPLSFRGLHDLPGLATNPLSPLDWSIRRISTGGGFRHFVVFLYGCLENMYKLFKIDQHAPDMFFLLHLVEIILKPPTMWLVFYGATGWAPVVQWRGLSLRGWKSTKIHGSNGQTIDISLTPPRPHCKWWFIRVNFDRYIKA